MAIFEDAKLLDIAGPLQVFNDALLEDGSRAYEVILASEAGGTIRTDTGIVLACERLDDALSGAVDTLLITGGDPALVPALTASLRGSLSRHLHRPRRIGSICMGAFILAQLGSLHGHEATTHWRVCNRLQSEFPSVNVKSDAIFVVSDRIWTSAGVTAGIDMALAMVEEDLGYTAALAVAQFLVLFLKRTGGQSQFSVELQRQLRDAQGRFDHLHTWMQDNLGADLSVTALASVANMSPRNFARVYRKETGDSPAHAVEQMRVDAARRLLESSSEPIQRIADQIGFGDDERMRRAFMKSHGLSPSEYRSRFGRFSC